MANSNNSLMILSSESLSLSESNATNSNMGPSQASTNQQSRTSSHGPVAILWDIENCPVPSDVRPEDVAGNIRMALRVHPIIKGAVTMFSAYGDFNAFPRRLREGCQRTGVKLIDVPNGRKDAADKAILVDMFLFALDNPPPSSILLISGDVDFSPALHILGQRGYTVILVIPAGVGVSSALSNAGRFVWDWPSVARGEGFVPPKSLISRGLADVTGYLKGCHINENPDGQNDEEAIVYRGISHEYAAQVNNNQMYCYSRNSQSLSEYNNNLNLSCLPSSRSRSLPSGLNDVPAVPTSDRNEIEDSTMWVQPGDINGLKGQLVKLLELSGGCLPLVRVPAEYNKIFGRPLYVAEYGVFKLVNLLKKMADTMTVEGKGQKKFVYLRNSMDRHEKAGNNTQSGFPKKDKRGKGSQEDAVDINICAIAGCSSDEFSDDDKGAEVGQTDELNGRLKQFRQEMQELLVSCSCKILLPSFEEMYKQRYKKALDYQSFGVNDLEELIYKVRDAVNLFEEQESKRKFLVPNFIGG
ncbi:NYN domain [Macleaya cordata]|uniref:NYN domain n=1 Tax=Macleaya cordata TaxID=56857 RepID=A0A200QNT6_MACCD|nr:NYN domain [Macleaya cordata]